MVNTLLTDWQSQFGYLDTRMDIKKTNANNGDRSVSDTVALMCKHSNNASSSIQVRQAVIDSGALECQSELEKINRVFAYIRMRVRFVEDDKQLANIFGQPQSKELLITPPVLLSMNQPIGDCDDFSMLCCSMLMALGIQCNFITVAADINNPKEYSHIYCEAVTKDGQRIPLDTSHGKYVGWETDKAYRKQIWPVLNLNKGVNMALGKLGTDTAGEASWLNGGSWTDPSVSNPIDWNSLLPGIFGAAEKTILQTTQPAGYQTTGPNGSVSYVLPPGQSAVGLSVPGLTSISGTPTTTLMFIAAGVALLFMFGRKG